MTTRRMTSTTGILWIVQDERDVVIARDVSEKVACELVAVPNLLKVAKAMVLWFDAEEKNLGTFHQKMDLCKYAEWCARKALGQEVGEFEGVPQLVFELAKAEPKS